MSRTMDSLHGTSPPPAAGPGRSPPTSPGDMSRLVEAVYRQHGTRVYTLAVRMLGNEADAEDVTQEVLLQVVRRLDTFRGEAALPTWLYRVTVNAVLALRRKRATARERPYDPAAECPVSAAPGAPRRAARPDDEALRAELRGRLEAAIAALPDAYKDPFVLSDAERFSNAEIGELLGLSLPAVKSRLHRARQMLRDALRPYLGEGGAV